MDIKKFIREKRKALIPSQRTCSEERSALKDRAFSSTSEENRFLRDTVRDLERIVAGMKAEQTRLNTDILDKADEIAWLKARPAPEQITVEVRSKDRDRVGSPNWEREAEGGRDLDASISSDRRGDGKGQAQQSDIVLLMEEFEQRIASRDVEVTTLQSEVQTLRKQLDEALKDLSEGHNQQQLPPQPPTPPLTMGTQRPVPSQSRPSTPSVRVDPHSNNNATNPPCCVHCGAGPAVGGAHQLVPMQGQPAPSSIFHHNGQFFIQPPSPMPYVMAANYGAPPTPYPPSSPSPVNIWNTTGGGVGGSDVLLRRQLADALQRAYGLEERLVGGHGGASLRHSVDGTGQPTTKSKKKSSRSGTFNDEDGEESIPSGASTPNSSTRSLPGMKKRKDKDNTLRELLELFPQCLTLEDVVGFVRQEQQDVRRVLTTVEEICGQKCESMSEVPDVIKGAVSNGKDLAELLKALQGMLGPQVT
eukprot:PhF_6_TR21240/c0_g1_i3/m.30724